MPDRAQCVADAHHHRHDHPGQLIVAANDLHSQKEPQGSFFYCRGFTLAELIAVIVIVSIVSLVAMTSLTGSFARTRGCYDELLSQVQYARKVAIAQRRTLFVRIGATDSLVCYNAAGACSGVASPTGTVPFRVAIPTGVTVNAATIEFDGLGRYPAAGQLVVTVADAEGSLAFRVEHETGYVRSGP
ncbi:MAG: GspH/FimT family pseudopilin [Burkholderiales bacterium]